VVRFATLVLLNSSRGGMGALTAGSPTVRVCIFLVSLNFGWQMKRAATLVAARGADSALSLENQTRRCAHATRAATGYQ
jgi:hypothetical protein